MVNAKNNMVQLNRQTYNNIYTINMTENQLNTLEYLEFGPGELVIIKHCSEYKNLYTFYLSFVFPFFCALMLRRTSNSSKFH